MRKNFALLGATIVVCLVAIPAWANNQDVGQAFKQAAMALETTNVNARSASASSKNVGKMFKQAAMRLEQTRMVSRRQASVSTRRGIITGSITPSAVVKTARKKPVKRRANERLVAKINLSSQTMSIMVDGKLKHSWKISSGAKGYHTPTGSYKPYYMTSMHYSKKYDNAPMPHSVFFRGGYAVHATGSVRRLGSPASHGCVRLSPTNAKQFFKLVQKYRKAGTRIKIAGSTPASRSLKKYARRTPRRTRRNSSWDNLQGYGSTYVSYRRRSNSNVRRIRIGQATRRRSNGTLFGW